MDSSNLHSLIDQLPADLQKEVYNFAAFLLEKHKPRIQKLDVRRSEQGDTSLLDRLETIAKHCASLSIQDHRPAEVILGYDEQGMPS